MRVAYVLRIRRFSSVRRLKRCAGRSDFCTYVRYSSGPPPSTGSRPGEKSDSDFWAFLLEKIRKSEENQNKNQLTNTSINLGVMGISTLVLHSTYVYQ